MASVSSVSVYEGVGSILERINSILIAYFFNFYSKAGRIYGYMGENTTFGSVVWAVWHISRSDLVQVAVYASVSVYEGVASILEQIKKLFCQFNSKSGPESD